MRELMLPVGFDPVSPSFKIRSRPIPYDGASRGSEPLDTLKLMLP
ncbi:unnamed protein product [Schistosoma margrebowiei]|uniref:Uncharacterized protein n=1 Tax=Schistosoma margrebowiei TaxID=48269 RepID=A0A183M9T1_9TREM|nr:unnamed protein product [Schistosoma margrebowiei]